MNGARSLLSTLVGAGVDVCFANPGTSEMHFVAALDDVPAMRGVLCLFEGVVTGAADGYGRVADRPAATLLHLGPGLSNGLANLHNARRARTPMVNIVGDHATYHARYDAPLQSDIASIAAPVSGWFRSTARADDVGADAADAVAAALGPPGCVATLVLPADASWSESATGPAAPRPRGRPSTVPGETIDEVADALRGGEPSALLLGGRALRAAGLQAASRVAVTSGALLLGETFPANLERGAGIPAVDRLAYLAEMAQAQLDGIRHLVLVDAKSPVSFFAYPDTVVTCGEKQFLPDQNKDTLVNPVLIFEVLSDSTRDYDLGLKFVMYKTIPSFREFVAVEQSAIYLHHWQLMAGEWVKSDATDKISLSSIAGISLSVADIYLDVF